MYVSVGRSCSVQIRKVRPVLLSHICSTVPLALNLILNIEIFSVIIFLSILQTYVRDIYPFRRSVSPQLNLVHMLPEKGQELIQKQVKLEM